MNYVKIYDAIIKKAQLENRQKGIGIYYENHHIIPKCLNGPDCKDNKVLLTAKEHFIAHKILVKIYLDKKIKLSFVNLCFQRSKNQKRKIPSSRDYQYARELNAEAKKGNKNRLGKKHKHPESAKIRISEYTKAHTPKYAFKKGQIPWNKNKLTNKEKEFILTHIKSNSELAEEYNTTPRIICMIKHNKINYFKKGFTDEQVNDIKERSKNIVQIAKILNTTYRIVCIIKNQNKLK